jgi:hypothetical protein
VRVVRCIQAWTLEAIPSPASSRSSNGSTTAGAHGAWPTVAVEMPPAMGSDEGTEEERALPPRRGRVRACEAWEIPGERDETRRGAHRPDPEEPGHAGRAHGGREAREEDADGDPPAPVTAAREPEMQHRHAGEQAGLLGGMAKQDEHEERDEPDHEPVECRAGPGHGHGVGG